MKGAAGALQGISLVRRSGSWRQDWCDWSLFFVPIAFHKTVCALCCLICLQFVLSLPGVDKCVSLFSSYKWTTYFCLAGGVANKDNQPRGDSWNPALPSGHGHVSCATVLHRGCRQQGWQVPTEPKTYEVPEMNRDVLAYWKWCSPPMACGYCVLIWV